MRWIQSGRRGSARASRTPKTPRQGVGAPVAERARGAPDDLDRRLRSVYDAAIGTVDHAGLERRLRVRLMVIGDELAARPRRRPWRARRTLALSLAALLLLGGSVLAVAAHVLPDDITIPPPSILNQLGDHLPGGAKQPITRAQAGIWLVSLPCPTIASQRAGETTWHVHRDCSIPYNIQPQIPDSVGSQARWDVLMMIALQHYQDYWMAHPGWTAATAPQVDAQAQHAVAQALNNYLDGKPVMIRYASPIHLAGGESFGPERLRETHDVERERERTGR